MSQIINMSQINDEQEEIVYEEWMYDLTVVDFVIAGLIPIDKAVS